MPARGRLSPLLGLALALPLSLASCSKEIGSPSTSPSKRVDETIATEQERRFTAGAVAFGAYCALCHAGDGTGYAADNAPSLVSASFLESASDEFITRAIREGRPGTAMASYATVRGGPLEDSDIADIIAFLRDPSRGRPMRAQLSMRPITGDVTRGEAIYGQTCQRCHGTRTNRGMAVHLANTAFLAAASDAYLRYAIIHGRDGTPMPSFANALSDQQIDDVVSYLRSFGAPAESPRPVQREPPPITDPVINPKGGAPEFNLRADRFVPIDEVKRAFEQKKRMVIIDARAVPDWYAMHIPGSISVPYYAFQRLDDLPKDGTWILAYCACPHHASGVVVDELKKRGYPKTAVLDEGILEWNKRKYPVATDPLP